jgi:hypothetical protein
MHSEEPGGQINPDSIGSGDKKNNSRLFGGTKSATADAQQSFISSDLWQRRRAQFAIQKDWAN